VTSLTLLLWIVNSSITVFLCYIRFSFSERGGTSPRIMFV